MLALVLAFAASLSYGVGDFIAGFEARRTSLWTVLLFTQLTGLLLMVLIVALRGEPFPPSVLAPGLVAGLLMALFAAAYYKALAVGVMGIIAPIVSLSVAVPVIVGFAGGERPSALQLAGIAAAVAGVVLASREKTVDDGVRADRGAARSSRAGIGLALLAATAYGVAMVLYAHGAKADPYWNITLSRATSAAVFVAAVAVVRPTLRVTRRSVVPLMISGALAVCAFTLFSVASTFAYLSIVSVLGSIYPVFIALLAYVVLHERLTRAQLVGVAAALTGVALIAAG